MLVVVVVAGVVVVGVDGNDVPGVGFVEPPEPMVGEFCTPAIGAVASGCAMVGVIVPVYVCRKPVKVFPDCVNTRPWSTRSAADPLAAAEPRSKESSHKNR